MRTYLFLVCVFLCLSCSSPAQLVVKARNPHVQYSGRIAMRNDSSAELSWPASAIKINFSGTRVSAVLKDEKSDNNYNVIVDGNVVSVLHPLQEKKEYILADNLVLGKHKLELFKRTESSMGKTWFYEFAFPKESEILSPPPPPKPPPPNQIPPPRRNPLLPIVPPERAARERIHIMMSKKRKIPSGKGRFCSG